MELIPMPDLVDREVYQIRCRNLIVGVWHAKARGFIGIRTKFDARYLFTEYHYDADPHVGTVRLMEPLGIRIPDDFDLAERSTGLFEFLERCEVPVLEAMRRRDEEEEAERQSLLWRPQTLEEHYREKRHASAREWMQAQRAAGLLWEDIMQGYKARLRGDLDCDLCTPDAHPPECHGKDGAHWRCHVHRDA